MVSISIIIPVYNVEPYIKTCLQSVISQTYTGPIECILVDDCGVDNSIGIAKDIIDSYHGPIRFHILHHEHNQGLSAARNTGMNIATGEYICFVDSDDELTIDSIERLVMALDNNHYDIVVGNTKTLGNDNLNEYLRMKLDDGTILYDSSIINYYRSHWNMLAPGKLYNMSFLRQQHLNFKEGLIHEDELWSFEIACTAKTLKAIQHITYLYYIRERSITAMTNNNLRKKTDAKIVIVEEMSKFLKDRNLFSPHAYAIIQKIIEEILHYEIANRSGFRKTYLKLRKKTSFTWIYRIRANNGNFRKCIRELHYFMPARLGERYKHWRITR